VTMLPSLKRKANFGATECGDYLFSEEGLYLRTIIPYYAHGHLKRVVVFCG